MLTAPAYEPDTLTRYLHLALYDAYAMLNSDDEDEPDLELTAENVEVLRDIVAEQAKAAGYPTKATHNFRRVADVGEWLKDERKHSPYVDLVAVRRALDFDWPVIRNLTEEERYAFYRRLRDDRSWDAPSQGQRANEKLTARQRRWLEGSTTERAAVTHGAYNQVKPARVRELHCLGCKEPLHYRRNDAPHAPAGKALHKGRGLCVMCHKREERKP